MIVIREERFTAWRTPRLVTIDDQGTTRLEYEYDSEGNWTRQVSHHPAGGPRHHLPLTASSGKPLASAGFFQGSRRLRTLE